MSDVFESRWFKIAALFFAGVNIAYSAWMFSVARSLLAASNNPINNTETRWMWWVSVIWLVLSIFFFFWCAWRLLFSQKFRVTVTSGVGEYITTTQGGFSPDVFTTTPVNTGKTLKAAPGAVAAAKAVGAGKGSTVTVTRI
jgi:hypothetical protein